MKTTRPDIFLIFKVALSLLFVIQYHGKTDGPLTVKSLVMKHQLSV